jgi:monolysocardiolipin acyltransferase
MRHALGSADICFRHPLPSHFFTLGQVHRTFRLHKSPLGGLFQPTLNQLPHLLSGGGWVHIFPEGRVHQHPTHQMRYFKWGVSRLILEPEVAPVVVPMFITGLEQVMAEDRGWPRFIPRVGKKVEIVYGDAVPTERWEDVRAAWQALRGEEGEEAAKLRIETTRRVREEVVNLRRRLGFPDEEPGADDPATYRLPGMDAKDGKLKDGSMVKDT